MDARIFRIFASVTLLFCLFSCTNLPSKKFQFSLTAGEIKTSSWSQHQLASSAEMVFKFRLRQSLPKAADVKFSFFGKSSHDPELSIQLYDAMCSGAYQVTVNYKSGAREIRSFYFKTKLLWDESSIITVRWQGGEQVSITINDKETHQLQLQDSIRKLDIDVKNGGVDIDELLYENLRS